MGHIQFSSNLAPRFTLEDMEHKSLEENHVRKFFRHKTHITTPLVDAIVVF